MTLNLREKKIKITIQIQYTSTRNVVTGVFREVQGVPLFQRSKSFSKRDLLSLKMTEEHQTATNVRHEFGGQIVESAFFPARQTFTVEKTRFFDLKN